MIFKVDDNSDCFNSQIGYYSNFDEIYRRFRTACCALGQLSLDNDITVAELNEIINLIKNESNLPIVPYHRDGAERAIFCITIVDEEAILEKTLEACGFKMIYEFHSRAYNPEDRMLRMWIISW